jgi:hypothetical protein
MTFETDLDILNETDTDHMQNYQLVGAERMKRELI